MAGEPPTHVVGLTSGQLGSQTNLIMGLSPIAVLYSNPYVRELNVKANSSVIPMKSEAEFPFRVNAPIIGALITSYVGLNYL